MDIIFHLLKTVKPKKILDYGCGGGWLSKLLVSEGYDVTGVDISDYLIENAQKCIPECEFHAVDCLNLPFEDEEFDMIIGIAILHHLDLHKGLTECKRVAKKDATLFFMEPNKFNPISALGNKICILDTHTEDEAPFSPLKYKKELNKVFSVKKMFYLFPYSFGFAYLSKKWNLNYSAKILLPFIKLSEKIYEKIPLLNLTCSQIAVIIKNNK